MIQLRLTAKAAQAMKVTKLSSPQETVHPLDDWYIDCITLQRKKYFVIMHNKSRLATLAGVSDIGGASKFLDIFPSIISHYFDELDEHDISTEWNSFLTDGKVLINLVKPKSNSLIAHMSQFKLRLEYEDISIDAIADISKSWAHGIMKIPGSNEDYEVPLKYLKSLMPEFNNDQLSNVVYCNFKTRRVIN